MSRRLGRRGRHAAPDRPVRTGAAARRWAAPLALALGTVASVGVAVALEIGADGPAAASTDLAVEVTTPVLSARRVPELVAEPVAQRRLVADLDRWLAETPAVACLAVHDRDGPLFEHRVDEPVVPASTLKLLTATAALIELGPDHRFRTEVVATAPVEDGTLRGDLHLVGGGDPLLHTADYAARFPRQPRTYTDLDALAAAIVEAGVVRIEGAVVGDESRYDRERYVAAWPGRYLTQNQAGPMSALAVNDGFATYPASPEGSPPVAPAADPAANAAEVLTRLLRERWVEVGGEPRSGPAPEEATALAAIESPPLLEVVDQLLVESDNDTGELLVKELGLRRHLDGSTAAGVAAVEEILRDAGIDLGPAVVADGSGLALQNQVSCRLLVDLLEREETGPQLVDGLAVAGERGTLADRFGDTPLAGVLRAKTGSLNSVASLAGVVDGEIARLTFAYVANVPDGGVVPSESVLAQGTLAEVLLAHPDAPDRDALGPRPVRPAP